MFSGIFKGLPIFAITTTTGYYVDNLKFSYLPQVALLKKEIKQVVPVPPAPASPSPKPKPAEPKAPKKPSGKPGTSGLRPGTKQSFDVKSLFSRRRGSTLSFYG